MMCLIPILINFYVPLTKIDNIALLKARSICNREYSTCTKSVVKRPDNKYVIKCYLSNETHTIRYNR